MTLRNAAVALLLCLALPAAAQGQRTPPPPPKSPGEVLDRQLSIIENELIPLVEAMPDDKLDFAPSGEGFKGVRTFKQQAGHVGAALVGFSSFLTGQKPELQPVEMQNGPELKTKAEVVAFLKKTFATAHKAALTVTAKNQLQEVDTPFGFKASRLGFGNLLTWHSFDHYGQMVVYARMNGVVPPASREQAPAPAKGGADAGTPGAGGADAGTPDAGH